MELKYTDYEKYLDKDVFYMRDELLEENPDIRLFVRNSLLMKDERTFNLYKNCNKMNVNKRGEEYSISTNLLYDLIQQQGMYMYLLSLLNNDDTIAVSIQLYKEGKQVDVLNVSKIELITAYQSLLKDPNNRLSELEKIRLVIVLSHTNENVCMNYYEDDTYRCFIDGKQYELPVRYLLNILLCSNKEYKKFLNDTNSPIYTREVVAYMLRNFIEKEDIFHKYVFEDKVYDRYDELVSYKVIDFESINKLNKSDDIDEEGNTILDDIDLNPEFIDKVLNDMDITYDKLEQAIYVYIRLCDLLSYDGDNLVGNHDESLDTSYKLREISHIDMNNNKVISYQFILIYAKILKQLGIKYSTHLNSMMNYNYPESSLEFKSGEYLAEVVVSDNTIKNDMSMVKIGEIINGIRSNNSNKMTNKKFEETVYSIYSNYKNMMERKKKLEESIKEYKNKYNQDSNISRRDKIYTLLKLISRKDLKGLDSINYILKVFSSVINEEDNITINVCRKNYDYSSRPVIIITLLDDTNTCFLVDPNEESTIKRYTKEEIDELINNQEISYMDDKINKGFDIDDNRTIKR